MERNKTVGYSVDGLFGAANPDAVEAVTRCYATASTHYIS